MDYLICFEDGSSACLVHHGIKGMRWGVWNDETKVKYGLAKGTQIRRLTSEHEARVGTDLSRKFYASQNQRDFDMYTKKIAELPSTSGKNKKMGLVTLEAVDDVTVLKGKKVLDDILKMYGDTPAHDIFDEYGEAYVRENIGVDKKMTVNQAMKDKKLSEISRNVVARRLVSQVMMSGEDDTTWLTKNGKVVEEKGVGKKLIESYKKQGYDAIEDAEDQLQPGTEGFKPQNPLIVINGDKFKVAESKVIKKKDLSKQNG